jgi:hypothetical protein
MNHGLKSTDIEIDEVKNVEIVKPIPTVSKVPFWSNNPNVLFQPAYIFEFFPMEPMTYEQKLNAVTLDSVLFGHRAHETQLGEFIKLDTQGTEFDILEGATRVLSERCVAAVIEVSFCELYKNQKLFSDVEKLMRGHGFSFYGFMPIHARSCKLLNKHTHITAERALYSDAIFFKDPLNGGPDLKLSARQNYVLFTVAILLNFYDFALELARETWLKEAGIQENELIERLINDLSELPVLQSVKDVEELAGQVKNRPELANLFVGNFVDRRRKVCDFDDVLNISPLPRML